jgi:hypothetical protein
MKSTRCAFVERYERSSVTEGNLYGNNGKLTEFNILSRCKLYTLRPTVTVNTARKHGFLAVEPG